MIRFFLGYAPVLTLTVLRVIFYLRILGYAPVLTLTILRVIFYLRSRYKSRFSTLMILLLVLSASLFPLSYLIKIRALSYISSPFFVVCYLLPLLRPISTVIHTVKNSAPFTIQYYCQKDKRWSKLPYATGEFGGKGCCPTVIAMLSSLTEEHKTPAQVAEWIQQNSPDSIVAAGTKVDALVDYARAHGWPCTPLKREQYSEIRQRLAQGELVAACLPVLYYSSIYDPNNRNQHFVLIFDYAKGYAVLDPDPSSGSTVTLSDKRFDTLCQKRRMYEHPFIALKIPPKEDPSCPTRLTESPHPLTPTAGQPAPKPSPQKSESSSRPGPAGESSSAAAPALSASN